MTERDNRPPEPPSVSENEQKTDGRRDPEQPILLNGAPTPSPNANDLYDLKKAQTLVMVASVAGPVSLFIGGVLLSTVGLVCAVFAYRKLARLVEKRTDVAAAARRLKRSAIVGLAVCGIALVLNAISFYLMMPVVLEMMETGDYTGIMADTGSGAVSPNSTWG